ncbi:conserved Plasmodium protein, unknown function [Plasmodium malariae]|uniref:Uncharacterized protein n=1 Tax=Plasmodium malariae TaxID=5858 RepID=A0A1C3KM33_PLAMA|nr:conserved Plasmodium protein, unknown function [Plasmodium malariae]
MRAYYDEQSDGKTNKAQKNSGLMEIDENKKEDNYVFIDEKYKEYFDNISDIFEEKVEYILKKHFKRNDPTNKNKLLCLNLCVLWQKNFLLLLSKSLDEYEQYRKLNNNKDNEKGVTNSSEKDDNNNNNNINNNNRSILEENGENKNKEEEKVEKVENMEEEEEMKKKKGYVEKDLKSYIKNVKIVDSKNIEVIYDKYDATDDSRPSAELSTDEIYYLLVESKKSENEYKKKIFTFLKYLPLFIRSIENKSLIEKKILEDKLLLNSINSNNPNELLTINDLNENGNGNENEYENVSLLEIKNKLDAIVNFNCNLSEDLEVVFKKGMGILNMQKNKKFCNYNYESLNRYENEKANNKINIEKGEKDQLHEEDRFNNLADMPKNFLSKKNNKYSGNYIGNYSGNHHNNNGYDNENENDRSYILPLSRINDLSLINNISTKSNNGAKDENNKNESSFYIYKNNMENLNVYGLDLLINLNNSLIYKINHIYSLVQFYTMLAKDVFNET